MAVDPGTTMLIGSGINITSFSEIPTPSIPSSSDNMEVDNLNTVAVVDETVVVYPNPVGDDVVGTDTPISEVEMEMEVGGLNF